MQNILKNILIKKQIDIHLQSVRNSGLFNEIASVAQLARAADL
ncbi:MAG: hypothetical protein RL528_575 [Bacteroidota bacterium]